MRSGVGRGVVRSRARSARAAALLVGLRVAGAPALSGQSPSAPETPSAPRDSLVGLAATKAPLPVPSIVLLGPVPSVAPLVPIAPSVGLALGSFLSDTGTHTYALSPEESDDVRPAIERAIAHMNFITRPIARRRLIRANHPPPLLTIAVQPDTLAVTFAGINPIVTPLSGGTVPWRRGSTGEMYDVHIVFVGDTLRQTIATDDGQRNNDFVLLEGGATIEMHVTMTAERLPTPLRYIQVFREIRPATSPASTPAQP
jgi:hypothetical protein